MSKQTLGGQRLGSGKKMQVDTKTFNRSTHDQGRIFRSTMAAGTIVPFFIEYGLPGTTFDIDLNAYVNTHPTIGPLFASGKLQLDVFQIPIRLYNSKLHNNALNIGRKMSDIKLPVIEMKTKFSPTIPENLDTSQINPSSLLAYIGMRGVGHVAVNFPLDTDKTRTFCALTILGYWDTIKNYYANKQEDLGVVLHTPTPANNETVDTSGNGIEITNSLGTETLPEAPTAATIDLESGTTIIVPYTGTPPIGIMIMIDGEWYQFNTVFTVTNDTGTELEATLNSQFFNMTAQTWRYQEITDIGTGKPELATFPLENIDLMREAILAADGAVPFEITSPGLEPYIWLNEQPGGIPNVLSSQEGLAVKTYQSDLFNNWLKTENIEAITTQTGIDVSGGVLTIDQFIISKKVWDMLNAINVSGGTYDDWSEVVYDHDAYRKCETPMYMGGLIKEIVFQEVVSNSESDGQPLGTLAGKGTLSPNKHKGGNVIIRCDEASMIMGLVSITPRLDYSQGNEWHLHLKTMDDFHKPYMDGIGFQDLITEQMAWYETQWDGDEWIQRSAGKQPAWINYMTAINKTYGNFAIPTNEMFMTFNRRYESEGGTALLKIKDLTTYIDPSKFNYIFAETALDAQNYWVQISIDMTSRRKMSAKIMPHL